VHPRPGRVVVVMEQFEGLAAALASEFRDVAGRQDFAMLHDDLAPINHPAFLRDIAVSGRTEKDQWQFQMQTRVLARVGQARLLLANDGLPLQTQRGLGVTPVAGEGEMLLAVRWLGFEPAQKGWMENFGGYVAPIELGDVMRGMGVAEVVESRDGRWPVGTMVAGMTGWIMMARLAIAS